MDYTSTQIKLWLEIDDKPVDVVKATFAYTLNTIPQASVVVAAGKNATTLKDSAAHAIAKDSKLLVPAKLWMEATAGVSTDRTSIILNGKYMLFEGYLVMPGTAISRESLNITMELIHWLSDLNFSSAISASSHPANPGIFTFNALIPGKTDAVGTTGGHFFPITKAQLKIDANAVKEDLWGKGILPWFKDLTATDRINAPIFGRNDDPDKSVQAALDRFIGDKLPMDLGDIESLDAARAIANDIASRTYETSSHHIAAMANVTLWDKLVGELAPLYRFAIVPGPDWAKVVPLVSGLRTTWNPPGHPKTTIAARDQGSVELQSQMMRLLGGYGLYSSLGTVSAGYAPGFKLPPEMSIGGSYIAGPKGMIMIKRGPAWLDGIAFPGGGAAPAPGVDSKVVADAMAPAEPVKAGVDVGAKVKKVKKLMDRMAQSMYIDEVLSHRSATIYSPLRFDICPGSNISFAGQDVPFLKKDIQPDTRYGMVLRVTYSIDAGPPGSAFTIFSLAHIRNAAENKDDKTSIARHPLYNQVWPGNELILPGGGAGAAAAAAKPATGGAKTASAPDSAGNSLANVSG